MEEEQSSIHFPHINNITVYYGPQKNIIFR